MPNVIHRLRTGPVAKRKFYLFEDHWPDPEDFVAGPHAGQYEALFGNKTQPAPGLTIQTLTQEVDHGLFGPLIKVHNSTEVGNRFSQDLLLDYLYGDFPIVTDAFKSLVDTLDPGVHQFVPVTLVWGKALKPRDLPLYRFICGRTVTFDTRGVTPWGLNSPEAKRFAYPKPVDLRNLAMLSERPDVYAALLEVPLWGFAERQPAVFLADPVLQEAKARALKGFEICTSKSARDVTDLKLGPPKQPGAAGTPHGAPTRKPGLLKRIFRQ